MTDLLTLFKGVKQITDTLMDLRDRVKDADAQNAIVDLKLAVVDLKEGLVDIREENLQLREEVKRLSMPPDLERRGGAYVLLGKDGKILDGPFCTRCFESESQQITLKTITKQGRNNHQCPHCDQTYALHPTVHVGTIERQSDGELEIDA